MVDEEIGGIVEIDKDRNISFRPLIVNKEKEAELYVHTMYNIFVNQHHFHPKEK